MVAMRIQRFSTNCLSEALAFDHLHQAFRRGLDHEENAHRLVDLDHLPRQSGSQVAGVAIHHADQAGHIVREFRAAAVAVVVDEGEVVLETDARADGNNRGQQRGKALVVGILVGVVGSQKRPPIEEQSARQAAPPDDADRIGAMPILGPRLGQVFAAFFHMAQRGVRRRVSGAGLESPRALLGIPRPGLVERLANAVRSA